MKESNFKIEGKLPPFDYCYMEETVSMVISMVKIVCGVGDAHNKAIYLNTYSTCQNIVKPNLGYLHFQSKQTR